MRTGAAGRRTGVTRDSRGTCTERRVCWPDAPGYGRGCRMGAAQIGGAGQTLQAGEVERFIGEQLSAAPLDGRSICVLVPDGTRSCPLPLLIAAVHNALHGRVSRLTVLVALGTHQAMSDDALAAHLG